MKYSIWWLKLSLSSLLFLSGSLFSLISSAEDPPCLELKADKEQFTCQTDSRSGILAVKWHNQPAGGAEVNFEILPSSPANSTIPSHTIPPLTAGNNQGGTNIAFSTDKDLGTITIKASYKVPDPTKGNLAICCETEIQVNLPVCSADKKGMTWGYGGATDIRNNGVDQSCSPIHSVKLACETHPLMDPLSNVCNYPFSTTLPDWETAVTSDGARQCNPYNGDTFCSEPRYVLCVAEEDNPYFQNQAPYVGDYGQTAPPRDRNRYKLHASPALGQPREFFEGWVGQPVKLSRNQAIGNDLQSRAGGDQVCGPGWRMASFDDGQWIEGMDLNNFYWTGWDRENAQSGGWAFHAGLAPDFNAGPTHHGDSGTNRRENFIKNRYWVNSIHGGNCWD